MAAILANCSILMVMPLGLMVQFSRPWNYHCAESTAKRRQYQSTFVDGSLGYSVTILILNKLPMFGSEIVSLNCGKLMTDFQRKEMTQLRFKLFSNGGTRFCLWALLLVYCVIHAEILFPWHYKRPSTPLKAC